MRSRKTTRSVLWLSGIAIITAVVAPSFHGLHSNAGEQEKSPDAQTAAEIRVNNGAVAVRILDPDVELTVTEQGKRIRIADTKTKQRLVFDSEEFSLLLGDKANRVRVGRDTFTLTRGTKTIVEFRRQHGSDLPKQAGAAASTGRGAALPTILHGGLSPDGRKVVTAHRDRTVRLWDAATGRQARVLNYRFGLPRAVCFAAGGREVLCASPRRIDFFDADTGKSLRSIGGDFGNIQGIAVSGDGRRMLIGAREAVRVWNVAAGRTERKLEHHMDFLTSVDISTDGRRGFVAGGYYNNSDTPLAELAHIWELDSGREIFELSPSVRTLVSGALSPDGRQVAAVDVGNGPQWTIWDVDSGARLRVLANRGRTGTAAFSADGERLATLARDGTLEVFETDSGKRVAAIRAARGTNQLLALSPDGSVVFSSDDSAIRRWTLPKATSPPSKPDAAEKLAQATSESHELKRFKHDSAVYAVAFLPDGRRALSSGFDLTLRLWDIDSGRELQKFQGTKAHHIISNLAVTPDGRFALLAAGQYRGTQRLTLWDIASWKQVREFHILEQLPTSIALSPDGRRALVGTSEGEVQLVDVSTGRSLKKFRPPVRGAQSVSFSPDGRMAVFAGGHRDFRVRLWDVASGKEVRALEGHSRPVHCADFSPDGRTIISAGEDETVRVWDTESGRELRRIQEQSIVFNLAVAPKGRRVVTGCRDGSVGVWDLVTGKQLARFANHTGWTTSVAVSPDGRFALSGSYDRTIRLWPLPPLPPAKAGEARPAIDE